MQHRLADWIKKKKKKQNKKERKKLSVGYSRSHQKGYVEVQRMEKLIPG